MSRIGATFERLRASKRTGLVTYVTAGDPDLPRSRQVLLALARGGADVMEVGVPFSDPIADGPVIQRASERALAAGSHLGASLDLIESIRPEIETPIVVFSYVNPVLQMGVRRFADRAAAAGVDGVLLLDLPIEEAEGVRAELGPLDPIFLISQTTNERRLHEAARIGRGFLYAISRLGVTGTRQAVASRVTMPLVARIRAVTALPIALGFGLSRPEHVAEVGQYADAAVVGSAIVQAIAKADAEGADVALAAERFVKWLKGSDPDGRGLTPPA